MTRTEAGDVTSMATRIYHFTHKENLIQILADGHLCCDRSRVERGIRSRNVAYTDLKDYRSKVAVNVSPYGYLDHYVPFYFGTRSPMMYAYYRGRVTGRPERTDTLVYFAATAEAVCRAGIPFGFTDGHPVRMPRLFSNQLHELDRIDFLLMFSKMWNDTDDGPDRMRRRQAVRRELKGRE